MNRAIWGEKYHIIQFKRADSSEGRWVVLVIDDRYDFIQFFGRDTDNPLRPDEAVQEFPDALFDVDAALERWSVVEKRFTEEPCAKAVVLLPAVVSRIPNVGALVYAPFAPDLDLSGIFNCLREQRIATQSSARFAALLDVQDDVGTVKGNGLERTWPELLKTGRVARQSMAIFSRGNVNDFGKFGEAPYARINKSVATGGRADIEAFSGDVRSWLDALQGKNSPDLFQDLTKGKLFDAHNPSTVEKVGSAQLGVLLARLSRFDPYGVWSWCLQLYDTTDRTTFAKMWSAAKAFTTTAPGNVDVPVSALVAAIEGARVMRPKGFDGVSEVLKRMKSTTVDESGALGLIRLPESCTYDGFCLCLRSFINHPEQFREQSGKENVKIDQVSITFPEGRRSRAKNAPLGKLKLSVAFDGTLPEVMIAGEDKRGRVGSATRAWKELAACAKSGSWSDAEGRSVLSLEFEYVPRNMALA